MCSIINVKGFGAHKLLAGPKEDGDLITYSISKGLPFSSSGRLQIISPVEFEIISDIYRVKSFAQRHGTGINHPLNQRDPCSAPVLFGSHKRGFLRAYKAG